MILYLYEKEKLLIETNTTLPQLKLLMNSDSLLFFSCFWPFSTFYLLENSNQYCNYCSIFHLQFVVQTKDLQSLLSRKRRRKKVALFDRIIAVATQKFRGRMIYLLSLLPLFYKAFTTLLSSLLVSSPLSIIWLIDRSQWHSQPANLPLI